MRKGVVIKLNKGRAILIAEDCTFCEIKAFNGMYKGMEVCFNDMDIVKRKIAYRTNKYVNAACFMLLIFCSYLFLSFYQENIAAYAYVGLDINPSIEIALNKKGQIIKAKGLDEEGKELLKGIDIRKMDSSEGVRQIIARTIDMYYLESGDSNEITVYAVMEKENNNDGNELIQKVEKAIKEEVIAHNINGEIKTFVSDKKIKNMADKMGMSISQYMIEDAKAVMTENKKDKEDKAIKETKGKDEKKDKQDKERKKDKEDKKAKDSIVDKDNKEDNINKEYDRKDDKTKDMNKNNNNSDNNKDGQKGKLNNSDNKKDKNKSSEKVKNKN